MKIIKTNTRKTAWLFKTNNDYTTNICMFRMFCVLTSTESRLKTIIFIFIRKFVSMN